jgi:hypothetical protein
MPASFAPPAKSLMNLTTAIDSLAFSPDQQVPCIPMIGWNKLPSVA